MRVKFLALVATAAAALSLVAACSSTSTNPTASCPPTSSGVSGTYIGPIHLGVTRSQAEAEAAAARMTADTRGTQYQEFFCPHLGVRVGYASPVLIAYAEHAGVPGAASFANRVVWISTSNPIYVIDGIQAGDSITTTRTRLAHSGIVLTKHNVGANDWWIGDPWQGSSIVLKVGAGADTIQEVGIATLALSSSAMANKLMAGTFY
jgi:hypothetical protein